MDNSNSPKSQGYIFPAEWEEHSATWLTYPLPNISWPDNFNKVTDEYNQFIRLISESEKVNIVTQNETHSKKLFDVLSGLNIDLDQIRFFPYGSNDSWCRDYGPAFLKNPLTGEKAIVKWEFNAWGNKYPSNLDNKIGYKIADNYSYPVFQPGIIMEGGSIDVNGKDTLITTSSCLLNKNRNPHLSKEKIETYIADYYGYQHIIWLNSGIEGDDTDGHIDDIARFVNDDTIIIAIERNNKDVNHQPLLENLEILKNSHTGSGKPIQIVELPMPAPAYVDNMRLPCSYANFYITNKYVIVPVFGSKEDDNALQIIQHCFPERIVAGIYSGNIIFGQGSWHCLSQQEVK
jgi:agmatine deiminase